MRYEYVLSLSTMREPSVIVTDTLNLTTIARVRVAGIVITSDGIIIVGRRTPLVVTICAYAAGNHVIHRLTADGKCEVIAGKAGDFGEDQCGQHSGSCIATNR